MKKHAYLIVAHNNRYQLEQLLSLLDYERNDIYLQVDSKGSINVDNLILNKSSLYILPSFPIYYLGYSVTQAILNLLKAAAEKRYHYYHLLSGSDLPLVSQDKIHKFLEKLDLEYVDFAPENYQMAHWKAAYNHVLVENKLYANWVLIRMMSHFLVKLQSVLGMDRSKKTNEIFYHGSTWFSITHDFVEYILTQQSWIKNTFQYSLCGDEVFLQTLLMKSPFKSKLSDSNSHRTQNLRYIDWKRRNKNSPYTFKLSDYEELKEASRYMFFARKFQSTIDQDIIDKIVIAIKNKGIL